LDFDGERFHHFDDGINRGGRHKKDFEKPVLAFRLAPITLYMICLLN